MKIFKYTLIISLIIVFSNCTGSDFVITNTLAYYADDDLTTVLSYVSKVDSDFTKLTDPKNIYIYSYFDINPQPIHSESPAYPETARRYGLEGGVWITMWVTNTGKVKRAYIVYSSHKMFNKPSLEAAMSWKFSPAKKDGEFVGSWVSVPFNYRLTQR